MRKLAILLITAVLFVCAWQQSALAISEGGAIFLLIRPGARACGMGSAFAAVADDASATYFNPAGLAYLKVGTPVLTEGDVKNWPRLLDSFRETDSTYLLTAGEIARPDEFLIVLTASPLLALSDLKDWRQVCAALQDSGRPAVRALRTALPPEQAMQIDAIQSGQEPDDEQKKAVVAALNGLVNQPGLYRQADFSGIVLQPQALDALKRTIADTLSAANIADAPGLWARFKQGNEPFAGYIYSQLTDKLKNRGDKLKPGAAADPDFKAALARELNRIIRKPGLYQPQRVKGSAVSEATVALGAKKLTGTDLVRFNRALLIEVFGPALELSYDSVALPADDTRIVNRCLLEALLGEALVAYQKRPVAETFSGYLRTKLSDLIEQAASRYDGIQPVAEADVQLLADGLNRLLAAPEFFQEERFAAVKFTESAKKMIADRLTAGSPAALNRTVLEEAWPGIFRPAGEKQSAPSYLKALLNPTSQDILSQYFQGKTVTDQVKKKLIDDLNALLTRRDFYNVTVFAQYNLPDDGQELINAGIDNLSKERVQKLNRRLLEAVYPGELAKMKSDVRYATLMHSPWLSEIWQDVGDMYYEYIAYAQPVKDWGVFGGSVVFLSEGQNYHTGSAGEDLGVFSSFEFSPILSYGNKIYDNLAGGINLKVIHSHLAPFGAEGSQGKGIATTWAIDLGALYKGPFKGMSIGLNVQNLGPNLVYISAEEADPLSRNIRGGIAYRILDGRISKLTAAFDLTKTVVYLNRPWRTELEEAVQHWGMEYWWLGPANLALRSGYVYDYVGKIIGPTFGFGVGYKFIEFDFSMEPGGDLQKYNRKFSLSANF